MYYIFKSERVLTHLDHFKRRSEEMIFHCVSRPLTVEVSSVKVVCRVAMYFRLDFYTLICWGIFRTAEQGFKVDQCCRGRRDRAANHQPLQGCKG